MNPTDQLVYILVRVPSEDTLSSTCSHTTRQIIADNQTCSPVKERLDVLNLINLGILTILAIFK